MLEPHITVDRYTVSFLPRSHPAVRTYTVYVPRKGVGWVITDGGGWLRDRAGTAWTWDVYDAYVWPDARSAHQVATEVARTLTIHGRTALDVLKES